MNWLSQNISQVFHFLPGFITAAIFYALTAHPKASEFERVIQALIFTLILKAITYPIQLLAIWLGRFLVSRTPWTPDTELIWMVFLAIPLGLAASFLANSDKFHELARKLKFTTRTSYPSEWYGAFTRSPDCWIILHLKFGRRLYGYPEEWPDQPEKGHFVIDQPEWVMDDGSQIPMPQTRRYLIPANEVERVEFLCLPDELTMSEEEISNLQQPLLQLHRSETDGSKVTEISPQSSAAASG